MIDSQAETAPLSFISLHALPVVQPKRGSQILKWTQPKRFTNIYWLCWEDQLIGLLQFDENSRIRQAIAKTNEGEWTIQYHQLSIPRVILRKKDENLVQAQIEINRGLPGTLNFSRGDRYIWQSDPQGKGFFFSTQAGDSMLVFRPRLGFLKIEAEVEIEPAILHNPNLALLTMLGWYLVLLRLR